MHRLSLRSRFTSTLLRRKFSNFTVSDTAITLPALNGGASFPHIWLRDSCQSDTCIHPTTRQKVHRTSDIPLDIKPVPNGVSISENDNDLVIDWTDGHRSSFSKEFLERHADPVKLNAFHGHIYPKSWAPEELTDDLYQTYETLQRPDGLFRAIKQLSERGLLFITGVPNVETSDEKCELNTLANKFGELRETIYGRVWDVRNVRNSTNVAYTNLDLGFHIDLLHFANPPRYQVLHCVRNKVTGGSSIFVDALRAAEILNQESPSDFDILASTPVPFQYINNGHHTHYEHPTIELDTHPSTNTEERVIKHINYSPPFQAPLLLSTPPSFYSAFKRFTEVLNDPKNTFTYLLKEGDAVLFDNRRVLHARTAFQDIEEDDTLPVGQTNR